MHIKHLVTLTIFISISVVPHPPDIQVYNVYSTVGSTAVIRCHVSAILSDYVHVTSWIRDGIVWIDTTTAEGNIDSITSSKLIASEFHKGVTRCSHATTVTQFIYNERGVGSKQQPVNDILATYHPNEHSLLPSH